MGAIRNGERTRIDAHQCQTAMIEVGQIESHAPRTNRGDHNIPAEVGQRREYRLEQLAADTVESQIRAFFAGEFAHRIT
jgi:hypothetical protein